MLRTVALALLTLLLVPGQVCAAGLAVGVFGGGNATRLSGDSPDDYEFSTSKGHEFGGLLELSLGSNVSITGSVASMLRVPSLSATVGENEEGEDIVQTVKVDTDYISVPLMVRYYVGQKTTRFFMTIGTQVDFLQTATLREPGEPDTDVTPLFEDTDISANLGIGVQGKFKMLNWFVEMRWTQGMVNLAKEDPTGQEPDRENVWKSRGTQFFGGVSLPIFGS